MSEVLEQHLIDPEICIRCNTCEATCPVGAITHDSRNYVVKADVCNRCMACVPPCPTGSIDNWRRVPAARPYSIEEQLGWNELPPPLSSEDWAQFGGVAAPEPPLEAASGKTVASLSSSVATAQPEHKPLTYNATVPPWSAAHAYTQLYGPKAPLLATVVGNVQVNEAGTENETHHIVLDFGQMPFPVLEGQSIGIIPPGIDAHGRVHHARQYSIASPRNGERAGYNNASLTVKRVRADAGLPPGQCSNYLCNLEVGDRVQVIGPFGSSFLMPNHPKSHIVMICTGTGSAPMRAMTEWRRRLRMSGKFEGGRLMLFFGARTQAELPYFGPLQKLPKDFIDIHFAFSRESGKPRRYVQDVMRERAADLLERLQDGQTHIYVCGLKAMEEGVIGALRDIAAQAHLDWEVLGAQMQREGRLHLETY